MKSYFNICLAGIIISILAASCTTNKNKSTAVEIKTHNDSVSYIIGTNIGSQFKQSDLDLNTELVKQGMEVTMKGKKSQLDEAAVKKVMMSFQKEMMAKQDVKRKEEFNKNKMDGDKFLADNKSKTGVITTASGLQYKIIKAGTGPKPKETDQVKVNYEGKLINGNIFDSSYERKEPATFGVTQVIKGWTEALLLMPVGSAWELYIPAELAYGDKAQRAIPAGSTLIFKVELISIEKKVSEKKVSKK